MKGTTLSLLVFFTNVKFLVVRGVPFSCTYVQHLRCARTWRSKHNTFGGARGTEGVTNLRFVRNRSPKGCAYAQHVPFGEEGVARTCTRFVTPSSPKGTCTYVQPKGTPLTFGAHKLLENNICTTKKMNEMFLLKSSIRKLKSSLQKKNN